MAVEAGRLALSHADKKRSRRGSEPLPGSRQKASVGIIRATTEIYYGIGPVCKG